MQDEDPFAQRAAELRLRVEAQRIWLDLLHRHRMDAVRNAREVTERVQEFLSRLPPRT